MPLPKQNIPMLKHHVLGDPIRESNGICSFPAIDEMTDKKYVIKVISVPASQSQLDALLITGAYSNKESAVAYFADLADDILGEAALLKRLSRLEGFVAFEKWESVPMENADGFLVVLKIPLRHSLEQFTAAKPFTHLGAINLGLDLCAALSACRKSGYLYANLKPSNIFISKEREYRIGDIGFVHLQSVKFASLPDKYIGPYTPPEIQDAFSTLNTTIDIYAAGMVLYQIFNGGTLPGKPAPGEALPAPAHADPDIAEIILKACAPDPQDRWQDPTQMGQALVSYLQKANVNDIPIFLPAPEVKEPEEEVAVEETVAEEPILEEIPQEVPTEDPDAPDTASEEPAVPVIMPALEPEDPVESEIKTEPEPPTPTEPEPQPIILEEPVPQPEPEEIPVISEPEEPEESVVDLAEMEEPLPEPVDSTDSEEDPTVPLPEEDQLTTEDELDLDELLKQADELIALESPDEVIVPESVDIPVPASLVPTPVILPAPLKVIVPPMPKVSEPAPTEDALDPMPALEKEAEVNVTPEAKPEPKVVPKPAPKPKPQKAPPAPKKVAKKPHPPVVVPPKYTPNEEDIEEEEASYRAYASHLRRKRIIGFITFILILALIAGACLGGYYYYKNYYQQTISGITLSGSENHLTVLLDTEIDNRLLRVVCTDTYGNKKVSSVVNNVADFTGLQPATRYTVTVEIQGNHQLIGSITGSHTTAAQTTITDFTAVSGMEDGSVILSFTVQGPENGSWRVRYSTPGEGEKTQEFTGHMVNISNLTVGKKYTFTLEPTSTLYVVGDNTLEHTAANIIYAQDLAIQGFDNGALIATWKAPEGVTVKNWTVRCYNDTGYDTTVTVQDCRAAFPNLNPASAYTVEVKAEGMSLGTQTYLSANSITFKQISATVVERNKLSVGWTFEGTVPADGWYLLYTVDGGEPQIIHCDTNSATISPVIPGAHYVFTVQPPSGITVFGGTCEYTAATAPTFSGYLVTAADMTFSMCKRPDKANWTHADLTDASYTTAFAPTELASFVIQLQHEYDASSDEIEILMVIRNGDGIIMDAQTVTKVWTNMWNKNYGTLDIPTIPSAAGSYTVEIYFNNTAVTTQSFTVTE